MKKWHWFALGVAVLLLAGGGAVAFAMLRQGDPRWAKKLLGTSTSKTIGTSGCLLTTLTMIHNGFYKTGLTPDKANDMIVAANGFDGPNLKQDIAARVLRLRTPGVTRLDNLNYTKLSKLASDTIAAGGVAVVHVAHDGDLTGDHFVFVNKKNPNGSFDGIDPGYGTGKLVLDPTLHGTSGTKNFAPVSVRPYFKA